MSQYSIEKRISSSDVDFKLLNELESYILSKSKEILEINDEDFWKDYSFGIYDELGSEVFKKVSEYRLSYFPDNINNIAIRYESYRPTLLHIKITFSSISDYKNTIEITFRSKSARETVTGLLDGLERILKQYKNKNFIFYPRPFISGILFGLVYALIFFLAYAFTIQSLELLFFILSAIFIYGIGYAVKKMKPYAAFITKRNEKNSRTLKWLYWGFIGYILFSVIGVFLRNKIFGF